MNEHYEFCERCVAQAVSLLKDLQHAHPPTELDIRRRRRAGSIALRGLYDTLRQAFLTPIDREDLWQLCLLSERVLFAAEETGFRQQPFDPRMLTACTQLRQAVAAFPNFRRDETAFEQVAKLQVTLSDACISNGLTDACGRLADALLFAALKNE